MKGAPKGNQFWKMRSKHGKDALFTDAVLLWEAACEYFQWCDDTPLDSVEYNGKDAKRCIVPKMRAYTMRGLCLYLNCNDGYFQDFKRRLKKTKKDAEFLDVITQIEDTVYTQKFEGAAAGLLSTNIIARDLGLTDKQQVDAKVDANLKANVSGKLTVVHRQSGVPLGDTPTDGEG